MKSLYLFIFLIFAGSITAQNVVSGVVTDDSADPLIGATVYIKGTTDGTVTDVDGSFQLNAPSDNGVLIISYVGYETMNVPFGGGLGMKFDNLAMPVSALGLSEVVITGVMDIVEDRRTPVAVSTITAQEIQAKGGNVEFPDLLKSTPSIYVANQSGGYGDSEVFTRGFDQTNTAFLLNGQPINGMEDGKMYWSNWSGMTDVATVVQVQRGLGSSKLAISSVGGTTNIVMRPTAQQKGGSLGYTLGNDGYNKITAFYNTGMMNDKFGISVLATHWQGNGWADGTEGQGQNYFISAGYKPSEKHEFNFLLTGAPQWHNQNFRKRISNYIDDDGNLNPKYNSNWGTFQGETFTWRRNYYHKPVANINWDFNINESTKLSTVLYGSWGRGGGTGPLGGYRAPFTDDGQVDFDAIPTNNSMFDDPSSGDIAIRRASVNNHSWYGLVTNFEKEISETLTFSVGADLRTYRGDHFRQVVNLFDAPHYPQFSVLFDGVNNVSSTFEASPWKAVSNYAEGVERVAYSNAETISYGGVFGQLEYANETISAYIQAAGSNQAYTRFEEFYATAEDAESETVTNLGFNIKGGSSFSFNENNSVFFNAGYYSRQPFFDNIFLNFSNVIKPNVGNEDVLGLEVGYKFSNQNFAANVNLYRTAWSNRLITSSIDDGEEVLGMVFPNGGFINATGINQLHQGVELDLKYRTSKYLTVKAFGSVGDWLYDGVGTREVYDDERNLIDKVTDFDIDGVHVGGAAQTSFGVGVDVFPVDKLMVDVDFYHYSRLYSKIGVTNNELELPAYGILDFGISYRFDLANNQMIKVRANMFNATDNIYISQSTGSAAASEVAEENWNGVNVNNSVLFGRGRTWNISLKYSF